MTEPRPATEESCLTTAEHVSTASLDAEPVAELFFDATQPFADVFADSVQVGFGPFGVQITFALTDPTHDPVRRTVARLRMSPQLAFVMTQILRRALKRAREDGIGFSVPASVLSQLQLEEDI